MAKVVFTAAIMDLCHEGHLNLLREMRRWAGQEGKAIVVLHDDKACFDIKGKFPIQDINHRAANIKLTGLVDKIYITPDVTPAKEFDKIIRDHWDDQLRFMRGDDNPNYPAHEIIEAFQVEEVLIPYTEGISSSLIREGLLWL